MSVFAEIGVKPQGLPPIYQPDIVVDAILYAACCATRNIIAGGARRAIDLIQRLSPQLMDTLLLQAGAGFKLQKTSESKSKDAPDNLFELSPASIALREILASNHGRILFHLAGNPFRGKVGCDRHYSAGSLRVSRAGSVSLQVE